jgi:hypothetical protein
MKTGELTRFLTENVEPLSHPIYGNRYRAAARLTDGTYLPCVVFQSKKTQVELALRRFKQVRWKASQYKAVIESFVSKGSRVADYDLKAVEMSPYAWPVELLNTIHGETTMGWTAFVAEMTDATMHPYGTQFSLRVLRASGRLFVLANTQDLQRDGVLADGRAARILDAVIYRYG